MTKLRTHMAITMAEVTWGAHPMHWLRPPRQRPRWYQRRLKRHMASVESVFGPLSDAMMAAYWAEAGNGQSIYEDAGGAMLRPYLAMLGEDTEEPYTYPKAISDLVIHGALQEDGDG